MRMLFFPFLSVPWFCLVSHRNRPAFFHVANPLRFKIVFRAHSVEKPIKVLYVLFQVGQKFLCKRYLHPESEVVASQELLQPATGGLESNAWHCITN